MKKKIVLLVALALMASGMTFTSCEKPGTLDGVQQEETENGENTDENAEAAASEIKLEPSDSVNIMNVGGVDISLAQYRLFLLTRAMSYGADALNEENIEVICDAALEDVKEYASFAIKANADGVTLSDESRASADAQMKQIKDALGEEYEKQLSDYFFTEKTYYDIILAQLLANQSIEEAVANGAFSDQAILDYVKENYVRVKHILLMTQGKDEAEKAEILERAENVLDRAKSGESFEDLVTEFSEDGMDVDTGYYFTYGTMVKEFEDTSYALEEGEISGLVESSYGYHIIKKYPMENEYILGEESGIANEVKYNLATQDYQSSLVELLGNAEVTYYDNFEQEKANIFDEYRTMLEESKEETASETAE